MTMGKPLLPTRLLPGPILLPHLTLDLRPRFRPAIVAGNLAQPEHWLDMGPRPMHLGTSETRFDYELVATFHRATASLTSFHSPCTKGTIAPSTLSSWSAGPGGGVGVVASNRLTAGVFTTT
jgi:hypothetical protein